FTNVPTPQFQDFVIDTKAGTITMVGASSVIQHYIDDGRKRDENIIPGRVGLDGRDPRMVGVPVQPVPPPVILPNGGVIRIQPGVLIRPRVMIQPRVVPAPAPVPLPPAPPK